MDNNKIKPLVSIVIPTYNDEKFICRCLDSIMKQTFTEYEVIVVLDGTTDSTKELAMSYSGKIRNLNVIYQENAGAGRARNNGIDHSQGDYIVFVDADDWLEPNALEILVDIEKRTNADYIVANAIVVEKKDDEEERKRYVGHSEDLFVSGEMVSKTYFNLDCDSSSHSPWGKLFKASIIKDHDVRFPDLMRSQDIAFNNTYARYINSIFVSKQYIYNFWNTIYSAKVYKDKKNRRNSPRFIEAEKNHLGTMSKVVGTFYDTMKHRGYILSKEEQQQKNDNYLAGVYNNVVATSKRGKANVLYALSTYSNDVYYQNAIASPKSMIAYRIFAFFLRHRMHLTASKFALLCDGLNDIVKKIKG